MLISDGTSPPTALTDLLSYLLLSCLISSDPAFLSFLTSFSRSFVDVSAQQFGTFKATLSRLLSPQGYYLPSPSSNTHTVTETPHC